MAIAAPVLTATNNSDGTVTIAISGGDAGASNAIRYTTLQQPLGWTLLGTISGNNTTTFTINPGAYWFCAFATKLTDANFSMPVDAIITSATTAIFEQILIAVKSKLQGAADLGAFGSMGHTRIVRMDVVNLDRISCGLPCIIMTPGLQESEGETTTTSADITYPVLLGIYDAKMDIEEGTTASYFLWRENMRQLFHEKHLPGIGRSVRGIVQPNIILDHKESSESLYGFTSSLQVLFTVRELIWA